MNIAKQNVPYNLGRRNEANGFVGIDGNGVGIGTFAHRVGTFAESLQYQKPIIAYLTPQYQGRGEYFPAGAWKEMLTHSLTNKNVDGVCVYQSVVAGAEFDPSANWWTETLEVIGAP